MGNGVKPTTVDFNTDATTPIYEPTTSATVRRVEVPNSGSTAEFDIEATDGSNTVVLASSGAGGSVSITNPIPLDGSWSLQLDVTTVEGGALSETAFVFAEPP